MFTPYRIMLMKQNGKYLKNSIFANGKGSLYCEHVIIK